MRTLNILSLVLLIIGGLNWLLFGLFQWDLVGGIFGGMSSPVSRIIYVIVGVAAIYAFSLFNKVADDSRPATAD
ncbi:DUF378 domain-containing protein [Paenibacillus sp. J2TS4]|uniref:DUF378 domain-containing protein n=1 Tax=Paenibacillus sp. J2TS4 TaxID=2807194 RepID=UPI001B2C72D2|nr:DUF378 domain-containing protein [Paenibacillus sp. J2TS4]GIP34113.1 DUF378 domain-containing protein [Paenibacillus sp. J2TS4]